MNQKNQRSTTEPWLRGTHTEIPAVARAVVHALELAREDLLHWAGELTDEELNARPAGIAPVAFHLRHIARSLDRLLTYAEGGQLTAEQIAQLRSELAPDAEREEVFRELAATLKESEARVRSLAGADPNEKREVGTKRLPTTVGGILVHVADHTQRHVGQAITTAKTVLAQRGT